MLRVIDKASLTLPADKEVPGIFRRSPGGEFSQRYFKGIRYHDKLIGRRIPHSARDNIMKIVFIDPGFLAQPADGKGLL